jgi:hypothetical protein
LSTWYGCCAALTEPRKEKHAGTFGIAVILTISSLYDVIRS